MENQYLKKYKIHLILFFILALFLLTACGNVLNSEEYLSLESSYNEILSKYEEVSSELAESKETNLELSNDIDNLNISIDSLNSNIEALKEEITILTQEKQELNESYLNLESEYQDLNTEYEQYKDDMSIYEELSKAEAEAQIAQEKLQEEQDRIALEKLQEEQAAEEARLKAEEEAKKEAEEKLGYNTGITYDQLARTPDDYEGKKVKFSGKVIQVIEDDDYVMIRFAANNNYNTIILALYEKNIVSSRILDDDYITIYGIASGLYSYESTGAGTITIPFVEIDKIDQ